MNIGHHHKKVREECISCIRRLNSIYDWTIHYIATKHQMISEQTSSQTNRSFFNAHSAHAMSHRKYAVFFRRDCLNTPCHCAMLNSAAGSPVNSDAVSLRLAPFSHCKGNRAHSFYRRTSSAGTPVQMQSRITKYAHLRLCEIERDDESQLIKKDKEGGKSSQYTGAGMDTERVALA